MDRQKRRYLERRGIKVDAHDGDGRRKEVRVRGRGERFEFSDHADEEFDLKAIRDGLRSEDPSFAAFLDWFHRHVVRVDGVEYRRAYWRLARKYAQTLGDRPRSIESWLFDPKDLPFGRARLWHANVMAYFMAGGASLLLWYIVKFMNGHLRRLRRPTYYQAERERRLGLAAERRRIRRRTTVNPCPTPEMLRKAFAVALDSNENMIRFGSMLEDLECYVDNSLILDRETMRIKGRRGGIRRYLEANVPELAARYKTVMRYKALAKRFRQAVGVGDPVPASALLGDGNSPKRILTKARADVSGADGGSMDAGGADGGSVDARGAEGGHGGNVGGHGADVGDRAHVCNGAGAKDGEDKGTDASLEEARAAAKEIIAAGGGSFSGMEAALELLLSVDCISSADMLPNLAADAIKGDSAIANAMTA